MIKLSQEILIYNHMLKYGSITQLEAFLKYKCFRLASRVFSLRRRGIEIITLKITKNDKTFAKYVLVSDEKKDLTKK